MGQMHWYTTLRNSVNIIEIEKEQADSVVAGTDNVCRTLRDEAIRYFNKKNTPYVIAMDGYLGAEWNSVIEQVTEMLKEVGLDAVAIDSRELYRSREWIDTFIKKYTESDPSLGTACTDKLLDDIMDSDKMCRYRKKILDMKKRAPEKIAVIFCHGVGSAIKPMRNVMDRVYFFDLTRVSVMMKKFANQLREPFLKEPEEVYWKREMYFYYHVLDKHRKDVVSVMDGYVDGNDQNNLKLIPRQAYDQITWTLVQFPLKCRRFMQPGNWGGLHQKEYFNCPDLTNCAWDTMFYGPKQSCLVDIGIGCNLEIPFLNLQLQYPEHVCGPYLTKKYPGLLPMIACVDDGYFPKPVNPERSNMPVHLHPDGEYVKSNFNERLGRYETYYIVEAYENANTMLGLTEDADVKEFKQKILDAEAKGIKFDWTQYVKTWPSKPGDLYLIPSGTIHGTGGHQMVLEMDTCPSNVGTEYSFFIYDFLRATWDDVKKAFCGKLTRLQVKHGFAQTRWNRREKWVKKNLLAKPRVIRQGDGWSEEQYASFGAMPFHIERLHFEKSITADTQGRFCHLVCLTKGDRALIRSKTDPTKKIELEWIQFALIPAGFGEYECVNVGNSKNCTLVKERWKKG